MGKFYIKTRQDDIWVRVSRRRMRRDPHKSSLETRETFLFMGYFVYILKNATDTDLYKGFSENPYERLIYHNLGKSTFTSSKKSWEFIFLKEFPNKSEALKFERRIKKWNRRSLYKLIESSENSLQKE